MTYSPELKSFVIEFLNPDRKEWVQPFPIITPAKSDFSVAVDTVDSDDLRRLIKGMRYRLFLNTRYWHEVRTMVMRRDKWCCQECGIKRDVPLEVHHLTYANHGCEHLHLEDMTSLCSVCHALRGGHEVEAILAEYHADLAKTPFDRLGLPHRT